MLLVYLVWCEAVQRSDWSRVRTLQLTQIGQERQISLLITTLVFPVKCSDMRCSQESGIMFLHQYINNGGAVVYLRCSLTPNSLKLCLYTNVTVDSWGAVAFCKLIQSGLGGWVSLKATCRSQKVWSEGGALIDTTVTELDNMGNWEEADHVNQQLESKSCEQHTFRKIFYY